MSTEPQVSADLCSALKERLQTGDKQDEIELYYELLSSGHSVSEILNAVGPIRSKSEDVNTAVAEHPQSEAGGVATDAMPEAALVDEAQVHALRAPGLSAPPETGTYRTEELQAGESPLLNEFRSDDWIQRLSANLPRSARGTVRAASAHIFTEPCSSDSFQRRRACPTWQVLEYCQADRVFGGLYGGIFFCFDWRFFDYARRSRCRAYDHPRSVRCFHRNRIYHNSEPSRRSLGDGFKALNTRTAGRKRRFFACAQPIATRRARFSTLQPSAKG